MRAAFRPAFTLIELLVVIAIIAILTALLTVDLAGVNYAMLVNDVGLGNFRDYAILSAAVGNTANFAPGQIALANAPGFRFRSSHRFSTAGR